MREDPGGGDRRVGLNPRQGAGREKDPHPPLLLHYCTTALLHYCTTALLHCCPAARLPLEPAALLPCGPALPGGPAALRPCPTGCHDLRSWCPGIRTLDPAARRTCGPADLRTCCLADLRTCGPADLRIQRKE